MFDSSVLRGTPLTFPLGGVIKGWYVIYIYISAYICIYIHVAALVYVYIQHDITGSFIDSSVLRETPLDVPPRRCHQGMVRDIYLYICIYLHIHTCSCIGVCVYTVGYNWKLYRLFGSARDAADVPPRRCHQGMVRDIYLYICIYLGSASDAADVPPRRCHQGMVRDIYIFVYTYTYTYTYM